jgi:hypothetical protein
MAHDYKPLSYPLVSGAQARESDPLNSPPGTLSQLINGRYDTDGAVRKRFGYDALSGVAYDTLQDFISDGSTDGDPTTMTPVRVTVAPSADGGEELLAEDGAALWRYSSSEGTWWSVGERINTRSARHTSYEARRLFEVPKVRDQTSVTGVSTSDMTVVAWQEGGSLYYSVVDTQGRSLVQRSLLASGVTSYPVAEAFTDSVGILYISGNSINMRVITNAAPAAFTTYTGLRTNAYNTAGIAPLDVWVDPQSTNRAGVVFRETAAGDLAAFFVTNAGVVSSYTTYATPGDPISVAITNNTANEWIIAGAFVSGSNVYTKVLNTTLVDQARDVSIAPSTAADIRRITLVSTTGTPAGLSGYTRPVYLAWEVNAADDKNCRVDIAVRDAADAVGGTIVETYRHSVLASKIWEDATANVMVTVGYSSIYQGVALVLRVNDQLSRSVIAAQVYPGNWAGRLYSYAPPPPVNSTSYGWSLPTWFSTRYKGDGNDYRYRSEFSQAAMMGLYTSKPRKAVRLRGTTYLSGTPHYQYDGVNVCEGTFEIFPEITSTDKTITAAVGSLSAGSYTYQAAYEWTNAAGERMRSLSLPVTFTVAANDRVNWTLPTLAHSMMASDVGIVLYRTKVNPTANAPKYRITGYTPDDANWVTNTWAADTVTYQDSAADTSIADEEIAPSYDEFAPSPVPAGHDLLVVADRLYLAGENEVYACKPSLPGESAAPVYELVIPVPRDGGRVTALCSEDPNVLVATERQLHGFAGPGVDAFGQGPGWSPVATIATNTGALGNNAMIKTPQGVLVIGKSGPMLLRGNTGIPMRHPLESWDDDTFTGAALLTGQDTVVVGSSSGSSLAWNYRLNRWATWTAVGTFHGSWNGLHVFRLPGISSAIHVQTPTGWQDDTVDYPLTLVWSWIRPGGSTDDWIRIRSFQVLGRYLDAHDVTPFWAYDDEDFEPMTEGNTAVMGTPDTPGNWPSQRYCPEFFLNRRKCSSLKVQVTLQGQGDTAALTHLTLLVQPRAAGSAANLNGVA